MRVLDRDLAEAVQKKEWDKFLVAIILGANPNTRLPLSPNLSIHHLIRDGRTDIIKAVIALGADIDGKGSGSDFSELSPCDYARLLGRADIANAIHSESRRRQTPVDQLVHRHSRETYNSTDTHSKLYHSSCIGGSECGMPTRVSPTVETSLHTSRLYTNDRSTSGNGTKPRSSDKFGQQPNSKDQRSR